MKGKLWKVLCAAVLLACVAGTAAAAEPIEASGSVSKVTVYRGEALVSRTITADAPGGLCEVLVGDLPEMIIHESLFATAGEGVDVRAVRFRTRAVPEEPNEEARKLDEEIESIEREIQTTKNQRQVAADALSYLSKLSEFVAPTAQAELTKGVLDAKTLENLTNFILQQRAQRSSAAQELEFKEADLRERLGLLKRRRAELPAGSSRTIREALLFIETEQPGQVRLTLSYLVTNAFWEPSYNLRTQGADSVSLEYNAMIYQMSGENWTDVEVTLSTASPDLTADAPELAPFWVSLGQAPPAAVAGKGVIADSYLSLREQIHRRAQEQRVVTQAEAESFYWAQNVDASNLQVLEAFADMSALREIRRERGPSAESMSVTYRLPGRASLASRSDRQFVRVADLALPADFYYVATPVLTDFVYREAEIANSSDLAMLAGPASVYRNGAFVGKSALPMVAQGQRFTVGLGIEQQLRASRELAEKTEATMGANKEINLQYRLSLENYMDSAVAVRLYDRLPHPAGSAEIRVTLGEMSDELSTDEGYLETERPKGILRWDVEVPAHASGAEARKIEYSCRMEFDRRLNITTPLAEEAGGKGGTLRQEFQMMNRARDRAR